MRGSRALAGVAAVVAASVLLTGSTAGSAGGGTLAGAPGRDAIVHLFQWPWESVARECTEVLGPAGFAAVQVSPPQEHVVLPGQRFPWWQDYQPVSYRLQTRRGDRAAFAGMVATCRAAGVDIYVDAVVNHMAGGASGGPGSAGSRFAHFSYPEVPYSAGDFHHCDRHGDDLIRDWTDDWEVQHCMLLNLADLATGSPSVRATLAGYLNDLISLGVAGFRIDAAKHVPAADLQALYDQLTDDPYVFHEVIEGGAGEISPAEYTGIGAVTEFRYGDVVSDAFRHGRLASLADLPDRMLLDGADALVFIDNHDTQRGGRRALTYHDGAVYRMAQAFLLAYPYGRPKLMSSFDFDRGDHDQGPPARRDGTTEPADCADPGWVCEHRAVAGLVRLRQVAHGQEVTHWWSNGVDQLAFGRGDAAFVAFNRADEELSQRFQTGLPPGLYCDAAGGELIAGECTGTAYRVDSDGGVTATVPPDAVLALHTGARLRG